MMLHPVGRRLSWISGREPGPSNAGLVAMDGLETQGTIPSGTPPVITDPLVV
jgi:hypothetical protein